MHQHNLLMVESLVLVLKLAYQQVNFIREGQSVLINSPHISTFWRERDKLGNNCCRKKKNHKKIGILGGTFDPPHLGHLYISKIALTKLKLDNLIWIIAKQNPLKQKPYLSIKTRIRLSKDITKNQKKIFVKFLDDKVKSKNTFDLLNYFKKKQKK